MIIVPAGNSYADRMQITQTGTNDSMHLETVQ